MTEKFLDKVYAARDEDQTRAVYDAWAASYEAEVAENGYATPARCAEALANVMPDKNAPILDFGCGTGLSGLALKHAGFRTIDGVDLSAEMLNAAREKNVYRNLTQVTGTPEITKGSYDAIAAIGVIGAGAAPIAIFDRLMHALKRDGKFVFSYNDHTLEDPAYEARIREWTDCGAARLLFQERGAHLPGRDMMSNVYVLERA